VGTWAVDGKRAKPSSTTAGSPGRLTPPPLAPPQQTRSLPPIHKCAGGTAAGPPPLSHSGTSGPTQCTASVAGAVGARPAMHAAAVAERWRRECLGKVCPLGGRKRASGGGGGENTGRRCGEPSPAAGGAARGGKCPASAPSGRTSPACPPGAALCLESASPHGVGGAAHSGRAAAAASSACWRAPQGNRRCRRDQPEHRRVAAGEGAREKGRESAVRNTAYGRDKRGGHGGRQLGGGWRRASR